jgi:hypothetical protein
LNDRWLAVPDPLPRARIVEHLTQGPTTSNEPWSTEKVENCALVERLPQKPFADTLSGDFEPTIEMLRDRPGHMYVIGQCCRSDLLVVSERYHSGWRAKVNGQPVEVVRTNGEFLGCRVAPLHFVAEFEFHPASLTWGKWLSLAGLMLLALYVVGSWRRP